MRKTIIAVAAAAAMALSATAAVANNGNAPGHANAEGTVRGTAQDANASALGDIEYLFNPAGYHFWFTATGDLGSYVAGDSYHNVYKYDVDDPANWCTTTVPARAPYNAGGTAGQSVYYKVWNVTTETWICGSDE